MQIERTMNVADALLCSRCKGKGLCGRPCPILAGIKHYKKIIENVPLNFSGTSPPSAFVGHAFYPNVNFSILAPPQESEEAWQLDAPKFWFAEQNDIPTILNYRAAMIASRTKTSVKKVAENKSKILEVSQEIVQASRPVDVEFWLKQRPKLKVTLDSHLAPIGSPAEVEKVKLAENPHVSRVVDKVVSDSDLKSSGAIKYLYEKKVDENAIMKILSVGLLGIATQRKLVPTRWSITAVDDTISKNLIEQAKNYPLISEYLLFNAEYLGNHFEIILLPSNWSFEVIEAKLPGSVWNLQLSRPILYSDHENYFGRKDYASNVTGAYYSDRLAVAEYLVREKRQASALILREVSEEYWAPMGVWVNRETCRFALTKKPENFLTLKDAIAGAAKRLRLPLEVFKVQSKMLKEFTQQKTLVTFLS